MSAPELTEEEIDAKMTERNKIFAKIYKRVPTDVMKMVSALVEIELELERESGK